jgi:hypothetical protein
MVTTDKRVDAYIARSAPFAQPILNHIRKVVHSACPDIKETIKWSFPNFDYNGSILCSMAAFKQHCAFEFWLASAMKDPHKLFADKTNNAMGSFGQLKSLKDLPSDKILIQYIKEAMKLTNDGVKIVKAKPIGQKDFSSACLF